MRRLAQLVRKYLLREGRGPTFSPEAIQELRAQFSNRYHNFKLLITANNKALEIMTDLEKTLAGNQPFGISFIRSHCTAISVNVFRMIKHLDELAPGKYTLLLDRFKIVQGRINEALVRKGPSEEGPLVVPLRQVTIDMADQVGAKMANLAEIKNKLGLSVPPGFVVTARAYQHFMQHEELKAEIKRRIQATDVENISDLYRLSSDIQRLMIGAPVPEEVEKALFDAYHEIEQEAGAGVKVSARSSALGEDAAGMSFAGQFRSILNVGEESLIQAFKEVASSKYGLPAVTYRLNRGIPDEDVSVCVGYMAMIDAKAGGVMYSSNPLNMRDRSVMINAVWGLPKAVVDGSVDPDVFVVSRTDPRTILEKSIRVKPQQYICFPDEGVCRMELTGDRSTDQSISDDEALALASHAEKLEAHYGVPQDIEWAITADGSIFILQCRPLKQFEFVETASPGHSPREVDAPVLRTGGVTASSGVGSGPVFVVRSDVDKLRFPQGAVLVASQPLPSWAPILGRAAAVVTEVGGVTGHLANVAREFGVPALFGLPDVTQTLKPGEVITVDAYGRTIYQGRVESLLAVSEEKPALMKGSPVYEILERAAGHIVPLNLLDPDSPEFHPKNCETLHDITRFVHEKSVQEMFNFGKEHNFSERSSKQLFYNVPMQWWIINLDDGFKGEAADRFVRLDNIACIPMLAIWEGAVAVPWEGPPAVDAKGLMTVLLEATTNTALDPTMASPYAARNYFMISKNFCSLSSRFGFHFSTVEALVGERALENYISFSFKGGAADVIRRVRRAAFVREFLERFGFRVQIKEDSVLARIEGRDEEYMKARLRILGYLIMHTRQLDMVMNNEAEIMRYRAKFLKEINEILASGAEAPKA
ncbi:MAG: pyruvate, water dikinase [Desulfomonile tiedjei]|nr:pyruvate, water dikinase [Desulfomonile tiedjei]